MCENTEKGKRGAKKEMFSRCRNVSWQEWNHSCFHAHVELYALLEEIRSFGLFARKILQF